MRHWFSWIATIVLLAPSAFAETVGTLTLDGLSYISFQDEEVLPIPSGSTIRFTFGEAGITGSVPFSIQPGDVSIPPITLASGGALRYSLAGAASGLMQEAAEGKIIAFTAQVSVTLEGSGDRDGTKTYMIPFTTETAAATTPLGAVETTGMRLDEGARYVQFVGATQNSPGATPQPGKAVYAVLSGSFDQLSE